MGLGDLDRIPVFDDDPAALAADIEEVEAAYRVHAREVGIPVALLKLWAARVFLEYHGFDFTA